MSTPQFSCFRCSSDQYLGGLVQQVEMIEKNDLYTYVGVSGTYFVISGCYWQYSDHWPKVDDDWSFNYPHHWGSLHCTDKAAFSCCCYFFYCEKTLVVVAWFKEQGETSENLVRLRSFFCLVFFCLEKLRELITWSTHTLSGLNACVARNKGTLLKLS